MGRIFYFSAEISNVKPPSPSDFLTNRPQPPNQIWATQSTSTNSKNNESKKTPKNSKNSSKPTSKPERKMTKNLLSLKPTSTNEKPNELNRLRNDRGRKKKRKPLGKKKKTPKRWPLFLIGLL